GQELPVDSVTREQPGLQIILAFNAGGGMAYSYEEVPRFVALKQALLDWLSQQPAQAPDVYHLITNSDEAPQRLQNAAAIFSALQVYQPDLLTSFPSSLTLSTALDTAAQPLPNSYSKRSILFMTALPKGDALDALPAQMERAEQMGVSVNVWLVGGDDVRDSYAAGVLQELAGRSGGAYHFFSGPEGFPSPEEYFGPLRYVYLLSYRSAIEQAGSYGLKVALRRADQELISNERTFQVPFSLPSPIFMNLPSRVEFLFPPIEGALKPVMELIPATVPLRILIEFPDGEPRTVLASRLYVDGSLVAQNTSEPFDQFVWSPEVSTQTIQYALRVEVEDERGLVGSSIETQIEVGLPMVTPPESPGTALEMILRIGGGIGVVVVGLVLGVVLLRRARRVKPVKPVKQAKASQDVRTRPLERGTAEHQTLFSRGAPARLVRLSEEGSPVLGGSIPLQRREIILGSDAQKTTLAFDSPSVQGVHARLVHEGTAFKIMDANSVAGTWVNYKPISTQGQFLQHGDLIHLGRVALRFELTQAKNLPQAKVLPYTEGK
ncbi:MAG TPA: FHA domain-containing protein, partial [Anaerolineaceae bacterium]|nr:FHA domain-containing protein [Anaerolineaceae bacterium]